MILLTKLQRVSTGRACVLLTFIYAIFAYGFLQLSYDATNVSPVWPPSGIAFIAIWVLGYRVWPGIFLGAFLANILEFNHLGLAFIPAGPVSALIGIGNSLEALISVFLLRSFTDEPLFLFEIKDIFKFIFSVLVACTSSSLIGASVLYFTHPVLWPSFDMIWFTWWLGDVVGILVFAPLLLTYDKKLWQMKTWQSSMEAVSVILVLFLVNSAVFMMKFPKVGTFSHITYLILPFTIWSTYRFCFPGAIISVMITSLVSILGSMMHRGPFIGLRLAEELMVVQCFVGVIAVTVLTLAAALYERKKAEDDIRIKEERFRSLVENSFEVIALVDREAKVVYTSPPTKYILGYDLDEILGHTMFEWIHPEDLPNIMKIFQDLLQTPGAIAHATCRMRRKDGVWRWMEGSGRNLLDDPTMMAVVVNYRDITERRLLQKRFEQVVEFSPVAKIMFSKEGKIKLVNKAAEDLFAYSRHELSMIKIENLFPQQPFGDYLKITHQEQLQSMGSGKEFYALRKNGMQVPVEIGLTSIETEQGIHLLASLVDITQRKKIEEILRLDKESLEQLVDERSRELIKTQKELKQYSRLADIGTLAATVAHELRNPLGVIHLAAYNLKREKVDLNTNKHLINIEKKVWEGNQIIDNLLSYARIKIPNYEQVNLSVVLDECIVSAQGRFAEKGVVIEREYDPNVKFIEADSNQIREVFLNIINNACQAITGLGGLVEVRFLEDGEMIKVIVKDSGCGIAMEDLDKIFEPFFTRKSKGTGLGLTICNELVNLHQGKIEVISQVGQGTTMTIYLPIHRRDHAQAPSN